MPEIYDLDALRAQRVRLKEGIKNIQDALQLEHEKLARNKMMIEDAEKIMDSHDLQACKRGVEDHLWIIDKRFIDGPNRGKWHKRHCQSCGEAQTLGHG